MKLPTIRADAAKGSAGPGLAGGTDEEFFPATIFQQGVIGGGKMERLRDEREGGYQTQSVPVQGFGGFAARDGEVAR